GRHESRLRVGILPGPSLGGLPHPGDRLPGGHRWRSPLRRYRPLRRPPHPHLVVRHCLSVATAQLLRPGFPPPPRPLGRRPPPLPHGPRVGTLPADCPRHSGRRHGVAGGNHGIVLPHPASHPTRLLAPV